MMIVYLSAFITQPAIGLIVEILPIIGGIAFWICRYIVAHLGAITLKPAAINVRNI